MQPSLSSQIPLAAGLTRDYLLHHRLCPVALEEGGVLVVAAAPDALLDGLEDIAFAYRVLGDRVQVRNETSAEIDLLVERLTTRAERSIELARAESPDDDVTADVRDLATQPPVVRYVNLLVRDAFDLGASDIHLEATRTGLSVRFRLDGVLALAQEPPQQLHHAIVSRVKLLAEMDIAERRKPQDGRIRVRLEARELDLRVSTVPSMHGESVVLRLLDRGGRPVALRELGMGPELLSITEQLASRPQGMLIVTGPTGSGKTTTLYACLARRDGGGEKIITVEDPVEYQFPAVTQVPIHRQAGVTFGSALRSILRQDPDVIMIGEMRDGETAEIAVQAAMTGHMVFTTLHTNDAISAVPRLIDLGVPEYLVATTVEGILAQRLVRRNCPDCREQYVPSSDAVALIAGRPVRHLTLWRGRGCNACRGTGFRGRLGLFELLVMTETLRDAITSRASRSALRELAMRDGMKTLRGDGWTKVEAGLTTVEEVLRVVPE